MGTLKASFGHATGTLGRSSRPALSPPSTSHALRRDTDAATKALHRPVPISATEAWSKDALAFTTAFSRAHEQVKVKALYESARKARGASTSFCAVGAPCGWASCPSR